MKIISNSSGQKYELVGETSLTIEVKDLPSGTTFFIPKESIGDNKDFSYISRFNPKIKVECGCGETLELVENTTGRIATCLGCGIEYEVHIIFRPL